jgi:pimeloyl-ACP methyl ester carboxylesterase
MPQIAANGLSFEYDAFGRAGDPAVLLIMGIGTQMIAWPLALCEALRDAGFFVVRFDNRDCGLSSKLDAAGAPDLGALMAASAMGKIPDAAYTLSDMAADAVGIMDALGIESAHVVGASMGGMIAQVMAIEHPARVRSLVSIMSTSGEADLPQATPEAIGALLAPAPDQERETLVRRYINTFRVIGSPGFRASDEELRAAAEAAIDRNVCPQGFLRQLAAILASPPRRAALKTVVAPTLVLHGREDPLIPPGAGADVARAVPGAEHVEVAGMGHDFTAALTREVYIPQLVRFLTNVEPPRA